MSQLDIRIGTLAKINSAPSYCKSILPHGFESFSLTGGGTEGLEFNDFENVAKQTRDALGDAATISSIGYYGNPLTNPKDAQACANYIDNAHHFGADIFCGFAGAVEGKPVPESIPVFQKVWGELARRAEDKGIRIAFENCDMGGWWESPRVNFMHSPTAWEMAFDAVPSEALGLQWEPCHQMVSLVDPLPQLRKWVGRVYNVHGKDATIAWDVVRTSGIRGGKQYVWHRTPGFGDTNWTDVISILRMNGYQGAIDIEGWHDPVYRDDLEMTGQVHGMNYLKHCRGGPYVANP